MHVQTSSCLGRRHGHCGVAAKARASLSLEPMLQTRKFCRLEIRGFIIREKGGLQPVREVISRIATSRFLFSTTARIATSR